MRYVKWTFWTTVVVLVAAFLHYTLPQRDIVRIVSTETRRVDFGSNSIFWAHSSAGDAVNVVNRDVFFIDTVQPDGDVMVFRNEDTGWGWPPYFKFDTANLQAQAADLVSTKEAPQWVVIRHYGWRNQWLSIFPNAVSIYQVEGPDVRLIPWFNIVFIIVLIALLRTIQVRLQRLWRRWFGDTQAT